MTIVCVHMDGGSIMGGMPKCKCMKRREPANPFHPVCNWYHLKDKHYKYQKLCPFYIAGGRLF